MTDIDWSKAPEGATHYHPANNYFYRYENGVLQSFLFDAWGESGLLKEYHVGLIPRTAQAWSGEGLPPVGTVCEVDWCEEWHRCEIIAHFQQSCGMVAAFTVDIGHGNASLDAFGADCFQPIRTAQAWSGEGLPPVGIECEVMHGTYGWIGAKVVGHDRSATIIRTNDGYAGVHPHEIRPIRTPEQIAKDEREAAIKAIVGLIESADSRDMTIAEAIYDAGFRKPC